MSNGSSITTIKPTDLRGILKYVPRFQGQIFVIAIDGAIVADENFGNLLVDIAVLRSLGIKLVLVHGIGHQLQELSELRNIPISDVRRHRRDGRRHARPGHPRLLPRLPPHPRGPDPELASRPRSRIPSGPCRSASSRASTSSSPGKVDRIDKEFIVAPDRARQVVPLVSPVGVRARRQVPAGQLRPAGRRDWPRPCRPRRSSTSPRSAGLEIEGEVRREISVDALRDASQATIRRRSPTRGHSKAVHAVKAIETGTPRVHLRRRPGLRRPAQRDLLERGRRLARLRQRLPADPQGDARGTCGSSTTSPATPCGARS